MLTDIVQEQLKLDEHQLKSIANAREFLEESVALRNSSTANTPESREKYAALRLQANRLLTEVVSDKVQERADELCGDLLSFSLPGMITPEGLESRHSLGPLADLLRQPAVQQELRLSLSVTEAIDSFLEIKSRDVNDVVASLDLDLSNQPSAQLLDAWWDAYRRIAVIRLELERECAKSLTAAQNSRLQQLLFQSLGPQVLLVSESAREALELTEQQLEDLRQIEQERAKSLNFANLLCNSVRRAADVGVLLSDQQRGKLQSLKGTTFRFVAVTR